MSNEFEGSIFSFPNFADIRVVRSSDSFKRGHVDFIGHVTYTTSAVNSLKPYDLTGVALKVYLAINVADGVSFTQEKPDANGNLLLTDKAEAALMYVAGMASPVGWTLSSYSIHPVANTAEQLQVTKRTHHDVVDTWSTNEIKSIPHTRDPGNGLWVRHEDYARKIREYQLLLAKEPK